MNVHQLPTLNAILNGLSAIILFKGWLHIKKGDAQAHKSMMWAAMATSAAFLTSYLYYHFAVRLVTHYQGQGILRPIYFFILITHVALAPFILPFSVAAIIFAYKGKLKTHTRITKLLWPVWMYVSVTGVVVYLMLYVF